VGGYFTMLAAEPQCHRPAQSRWDAGHELQPAALITGNTPAVVSLAVQVDGRILVGGYFTTLGVRATITLGGSMQMGRWT